MIREFPYLSSTISASGSVDTKLSRRLAKASQVFGCLREPVFLRRHLSVATKKKSVYVAVVLSTLLYEVETSAVKAAHLHCMNTFHLDCVLQYSVRHDALNGRSDLAILAFPLALVCGLMLLIALGSTVLAGSATWPVWIPPVCQSKCSLQSYR